MPTLTIDNHPRLFDPNIGGQEGFMRDYQHRYCALAGGWFAGKTWAGARKLLDLHLHNAFDQDNKPTLVKSAVIAPTYQLANDFDIPELKRAMDEMNLSYKFIADPKRYCFVLPDLGRGNEPSEILIRTADAPDRITGWTVGAIWGDEAARWKCDAYDPQNDPFIQADARLRDTRAKFLQFMVTFTHEGDDTRVYRDFERDRKPDHRLYRAATLENPHAAAFGKVQKQQLSIDLAKQYLEGIPIGTSSRRMYGSFDEGTNVDPQLVIDDVAQLQIAVDFNIDPGMHCIIGQHFPERDLLTSVWEIHEPGMSVREMVVTLRKWIEQQFGGWRWSMPLRIFGDASGNSRWAGGGESCYDVLREYLRVAGIPHEMRVPRANPDVGDRVNHVNSALCDANGRVKYVIHPRCRRLIDDYRTMRWTANGDPDKRDRYRSHASDADGYRVHYLMPIRRLCSSEGQIGIYRGQDGF